VIDPRITGLGAHPQQTNGHLHPQQAGPTSSPANRELGNQTQSQSQGQAGNANQGQSQSQNIPSISSMVHNHTPTPADDGKVMQAMERQVELEAQVRKMARGKAVEEADHKIFHMRN